MLSFPFGMPIKPVAQTDRGPKRVFMLGVYASAVHARWVKPDGRAAIAALAVASEPEIFWTGSGAEEVVAKIEIPAHAGRLEAAGASLNGPSGRALDRHHLEPLGVCRSDAWLCDLLPESRCNPRQKAAIAREYDPVADAYGLPAYEFPPVPTELANEDRRVEIEAEIRQAGPEILVTLGDLPLRWFARHYGSKARLASYGDTGDTYGRLHDLDVSGRRLQLLPLVHPRQAAALGGHSPKWRALHETWSADAAPRLAAGRLA